MHEMSLAEGVLKIIEDSARTHGFERVRTVWLEVGALAGVEADALRFCFDAVVKDSVAAGCRLVIVPVAGQGWCAACGRSVAISQRYDPCPACGEYAVRPVGGQDLKIRELEVD